MKNSDLFDSDLILRFISVYNPWPLLIYLRFSTLDFLKLQSLVLKNIIYYQISLILIYD